MSNARILADLMGTSTTVPSSKLSLAAADLPSGSVLQIQTGELTTQYQNTSSYADVGLSVTITPSSSSSKIYIFMNTTAYLPTSSGFGMQLFRDSTEIYDPSAENATGPIAFYNRTTGSIYGSAVLQYLDSPATTSAITYKIKARNYDTDVSYFTRTLGTQVSKAHITAMEIAG